MWCQRGLDENCKIYKFYEKSQLQEKTQMWYERGLDENCEFYEKYTANNCKGTRKTPNVISERPWRNL